MVAANLPDVDVLAFATETPSVAIRRGVTHGVVAQVLLPIALTGAFVLVDRWRRRGSSRIRADERRSPEDSRGPDAPPFNPLALLALCYVGVLSHVGMDWLNNYGVRLLMPFSNRWFYGDSVFIVDPWLWITFAAGFWFARRSRRPWPARVAVVVATIYIGAMVASAFAARERVMNAWTMASGGPPAALMVGPVPINALAKTVIIDAGASYERGTFGWWPVRVQFDRERIPKNDHHPAVARAREAPHFRALLVWARFPYYEVTPVDGGTRVTLRDMRFGDRGLFTVTTVVK
jgi:inner membrane protein